MKSLKQVDHSLGRIAARERAVGAWACVRPQAARAQAMRLDREPPRSPLHGVPVGIKDTIDTRDLPTARGTPIYAGRQPSRDAACVARLRAAGALILGKTVTVELGAFHFARTRNPRDLERTPGGSSSGSAAAVADGMAPLALGTQTGGSTLRPAAYCGVVGYKPSFGLVSLRGVQPLAPSQDTIGLFARDVAGVALLASALAARRLDAREAPPPRIALCDPSQWPAALEPEMARALEKGAGRLARAGARVRQIRLPPPFDALFAAQRVVNDYEAWRALRHERLHHAARLSETLAARLRAARGCTAAQYCAAAATLACFRARLREVLQGFDVLVTPSAPGVAPRGLRNTGDSTFLRIWTALHNPALSLPVFRGRHDLPLGLQVVGGVGADARTLACAAWIYRVLRP